MKIAIITGASAGIGRALVYAIDKAGSYDRIWVIARRRERLEQWQKEFPQTVFRLPQ